MSKNITLTKNNVYPNLLIIEEIKIYFVIFSTNKSVENLIYVLNKLIFNNKIEKIKQLNKTTFFSANIAIKNYIILKESLNFKMKEENLKFEFIYIKFKTNNLSVDFFEKNFLKKNDKQEFFEDLNYLNYLTYLTNKNFLVKLFLMLMLNFIKLLNNFKKIFLKKI